MVDYRLHVLELVEVHLEGVVDAPLVLGVEDQRDRLRLVVARNEVDRRVLCELAEKGPMAYPGRPSRWSGTRFPRPPRGSSTTRCFCSRWTRPGKC